MLPENCFFFSKDDASELRSSKLYGYGITSDSIIFGNSGLSDYLASGESEFPEEGRFCGIFIKNDVITIRADKTGQDCIFLYEDGDHWAVSNSFLLLASQVSKTRNLSFNRLAAETFHLKNGVHIGEQPTSHDTMIKEIRLLPLTSILRVTLPDLKIVEEKSSYINQFTLKHGEKYDEHLLEVLERGAGMLAALGDVGYPLNISLSGGYDSRVVLGMALLADSARENLRVSSHEFKKEDFAVAQSLTNRFSLPLNAPSIRGKNQLSATDSIRMYLLSCAGTYLPFYPVQSHSLEPTPEMRITGDQPTGWSHFSGNALFNGNAEKISRDIETFFRKRDIYQPVKDMFLSSFDSLGIDRDHPAAMLAYYSGIRSRYHCGRNWYKSLGRTLLFTPLMQSSFVKLEIDNNARGMPSKQFFADCFSAFGEWATREPFETPDRAFSEQQIQAAPFRGGAKITPRKFRVFGRIGEKGEATKPNLFNFDIDADSGHDAIKKQLETIFYRASRAKASGIFSQGDYIASNAEIHANGSLSHNYRKVCHVIATDTVLRTTAEYF